MITFYPGPSKLYPQVEQYMADACRSGILSANHRSDVFMEMLQSTINSLKIKLEIPAEYEIYFVSSATECWEIISQSLVETASFHIYNGAFGAKWMEYAQKLRPPSGGIAFDVNESPSVELVTGLQQEDLICITHNETSNGTALPVDFVNGLRQVTSQIIAVDATSSMGGASLPWEAADVWYASVQKCFGLPPGLGVMVVSPGAIAKAVTLNENQHYNSLLFIRDNFLKFQTPYTPNTLGIYLLGRVVEQVDPISKLSLRLSLRADELYASFQKFGFSLVADNTAVRSATVVAVQMEKMQLAAFRGASREHGIVLGNGYGNWKDGSFRVANFPAISDHEISVLKSFLESVSSVN